MTILPVVEHEQADPSREFKAAVDRLSEQLLRERPELKAAEQFQPLIPDELTDAPTLHLDDLSDIPLLDSGLDVCFMQDRVRLRAGDGDFVASTTLPVPAFEEYCRDSLGLGSPLWLHPAPADNPLRIAQACWEDRSIRRKLVHELRTGGLLYIHPHMGTFCVWELGAMLQQASRRPVKVVAPPPGVTKWVNDKIAFTETVARLFGKGFVPRTEQASNYAILAERVKKLAENSRVIGLKLPDSAGGGGNVVIEAEQFRRRPLFEIREILKELLQHISWQGEDRLLVGSWESEVVSAPSAQLWIPPLQTGLPIIEGVFEQSIEGEAGIFVGSRPASIPDERKREIVDRCWLLARLYQRLGYIGRCSFDLLLVGESLECSRLEFIECNGRWGGTSVPMTLMNRMFGDWTSRPYGTRECHAEGLSRVTFAGLLESVREDLFDVRTGRGRVILYNPGRMPARSGIDVITVGETWEEAQQFVLSSFPARLLEIAHAEEEP